MIPKPFLTHRFEEALVYATQLHANQVRKGTGVPYISHLLSVAALVLEDGGNEDEAIAALLHDAIEDQGGDLRRQEIRHRFGEKVTMIVDGCTDTDIVPKPPWRERKERYIKHLRQASPEVLRVSLADKLHNARSILFDYRKMGTAIWSRFKGGRDGTLWYYHSLVEVVQERGTPSFLFEELKEAVRQLESIG